MVAEVGFAGSEETGDGGLQFVVDPEAAHGVVHGGIDHHRRLVGVLVGDFLVHLEEVAVFLLDDILAQSLYGFLEVEEDGEASGTDTVAGIAALFGGAAGDVAGHEVAEGGIAALEVVVAVFFGYVVGFKSAGAQGFGVLFLLWHPDAAVVAEAFAHEGELGLVVAVDGDAGGVYLHVAGVGEVGAFAVAYPCSAAVAVHCVGGEEVDVAVAAGGEDHGMSGVAFQLAADEVADDDASGAFLAVLVFHEHEFFHLAAVVETDGAALDFAAQCSVGAEQELLAGLSASVEGSADLSAAERAVVEQAAIVACEGDALCDALVDDVAADFGQAVDVGLAGTVVAALDGVAEEAFDAVAVVLVVFGSVDATLGSNRVGAARRVLYAEDVDVEAQSAKRSGSRGSSQASAYDDDVEFALVGRVDKFLRGLIVGPFFGEGTGWYFGI